MKVLIVVDMQNDFIDGSLGTKEAVGIVDRVAEVMDSFDGAVICTRDTHFADYLVQKICRRRSKNWQAACRNSLNSWDSAPTSA